MLKKIIYDSINVFFITLFLSLTTISNAQAQGILKGQVTIGPLCPIQPCDLSKELIAQAYAAVKLVIYDEKKTTILMETGVSSDGAYTVELAPGRFVIVVYYGDDFAISKNLISDVAIKDGQTLVRDFNIDTGIR